MVLSGSVCSAEQAGLRKHGCSGNRHSTTRSNLLPGPEQRQKLGVHYVIESDCFPDATRRLAPALRSPSSDRRPVPMSAHTGKLLFDEGPIAVSRFAARLLGLQEAVFLQQLHYRLHMKMQDPKAYSSYYIDGRYWVRWTMEELHKEIPLGKSDDPFKRVIRRLRDLGVLLVERHSQNKWDHTNFYSISYEVLDALVAQSREPADSIGGDATDPSSDKNCTDEADIDESIGGDATDHYSKNSTKTSVKTTTTSKGTTTESQGNPHSVGELQWTVVPLAIRSQILRLIPPTLDQQRCIDLLAVRMSRDRTLPKEQRLSSPVKWFTKVIANPDFTAADFFAEERRQEQNRAAASISESKVTLESKSEQNVALRKREDVALAALALLDESALVEVSALAAAVCEYPNFAVQIAEAVSQRALPANHYAKKGVFKAMRKLALGVGA